MIELTQIYFVKTTTTTRVTILNSSNNNVDSTQESFSSQIIVDFWNKQPLELEAINFKLKSVLNNITSEVIHSIDFVSFTTPRTWHLKLKRGYVNYCISINTSRPSRILDS